MQVTMDFGMLVRSSCKPVKELYPLLTIVLNSLLKQI